MCVCVINKYIYIYTYIEYVFFCIFIYIYIFKYLSFIENNDQNQQIEYFNHRSLRTDFESSIRSDAFALKSLRDYQDGKLVLHAWLSRGLVAASDIAKWKFQGDESKVADLMQKTPNAMKDLLSLEEFPSVGDDEQNKKLMTMAEQEPLPGESMCHWCVLDLGSSSSDVKPAPLPDWFKIPLDRTIAIWNEEKAEWDRKKKTRFEMKGTYELTKKTEEKYQDRGCMYIYICMFVCLYSQRCFVFFSICIVIHILYI